MKYEKELLDIENKIKELEKFAEEKEVDLSKEIEKQKKIYAAKSKEAYSKLNDWDKVSIARHPERPYALDYINEITTDFVELHGDRLFGDDSAVVGGLCRIDDKKFMVIGIQKGRTVEEKIERNFGMSNPEGYRKALRLMKMAEKFHIPVLTLIDTSGAYPGMEAEERGQGEAIARNLMEMSGLKTPIIAVVIGEGGSGGALALGVADRVYMMEHAVYSVISPEGCAAILFKDGSLAEKAAKNLKISAQNLKKLGVIDDIIPEPFGGAHKDPKCAEINLKKVVLLSISELEKIKIDTLLEKRYNKFRRIGFFMGE
ncbi:acetyl-CoA carboxylase carboxyltransferase subunit alpha [Fusobacterium perfoetens]|uniref:acetyl-CoA carboxylase carboxyltransferase subunit alpha n=1 Tax=Fusobacterium perfoetens TaxID=852 RepID=UPI001F45E37D|nr:acetyl-CoA carboxylase carboxyltransferase subunit alpha [Fusobacterium perfoetens]MCF2625404.1 acetyl-CoA carboxylase carboxyltransferase subunit alpha [Fusobacterium perfoetens]